MVARSEVQATGALPPADLDPLTGVVARQAYPTRLEARLRSEAPPRFALLLVGIDDFRAFNDMHGHAEGDAILPGVARRLADAAPRDAIIGRVGSDEFGVLLTSISDPTLVRHVSAAILSMLSAPYEMNGRRHHVLASIGACVMPAGGENSSDVLAAASLALARAKHDGGRTIRFFKPQMRTDVTYAAVAGAGAARGLCPAPVRVALSTAGGPARWPRGGRRGADALAPSHAGPADARRLHRRPGGEQRGRRRGHVAAAYGLRLGPGVVAAPSPSRRAWPSTCSPPSSRKAGC